MTLRMQYFGMDHVREKLVTGRPGMPYCLALFLSSFGCMSYFGNWIVNFQEGKDQVSCIFPAIPLNL